MRVLSSLKKPDEAFVNGQQDIFSTVDGDFVVHPPVGKWVIAAGEWLLGSDSGWGWRFSVALLGTLSILVVGRVARRMLGSTALGCVAAFLLAFEGSHFVMSRTGILDIIVMFFALCGFAALLVDRDRSREVLADEGRGAAPWDVARGPGALARLAAVALGRRALAGPVHRDEVVGAVLPRGVRAADDLVGHGRAPRRRGAPLGGRCRPQGRAAGRRRDGGDGRGHLHAVVVGVVPHEHGLPPAVGHLPPRGGRAVAAPRAAQLGEVPPGRVRLQHDPAEPAPVPVEPVVVDGPDPADVVLLRDAQARHRRVHGRLLLLGDQPHRDDLGVVGGHRRAARRPLVVGGPARLAGRRRSSPGWPPATCRGSSTRTAPSTPSTPSRSSPGSSSPSPSRSGCSSGAASDDPDRWRTRWLVVGGYLLLTLALFAFFHPVYVADTIPYQHWRWRMWFPSWI